MNDEMADVQYKFNEEFVTPNCNTDPVLPAFTTAHVDLKLYSYLEVLDKRIFYFDTDSIIFTWAPGQYKPPLDDYLGDQTSELEDDNYITKFFLHRAEKLCLCN